MMRTEIKLSDKWANFLNEHPETGMGYQIVTVELVDGLRFKQVVVVGGTIVQIKGWAAIPFNEEDIKGIRVTHEKFDFSKG